MEREKKVERGGKVGVFVARLEVKEAEDVIREGNLKTKTRK